MNPSVMKRLFACAIPLLLALPAEAKTLLLTCQQGKTKYEVRYDTVRNTLKTNHRDFDKPLIVEKTQENEDGLLVWGEMPLGPATKNLLVHFGKEKWAMHFWGYDDKRKDSCI